ncbi:MAG TPA: hypothetical protein VED01_18280 [Burkholderiales bacterium]|nr:hypothetical protein [Burkholderiales bacterium]
MNRPTDLAADAVRPVTEEDLRARLGRYVAPRGLYERNRARPFVGRVTCNVDRLVAGQWTEIVLDYEVGASGVADGAWFKATFKFYSDWALFQTTDPAGANYVSAEYHAGPLAEGQSPAAVQSLKVRFDQKGHERPFQKAVIVDTVDGYLNAGDHIIIRLGDRRAGGPGTRVQTFVEDKFRFRCYVDPLGTSRFVAVPGDVVIDIVPGEAESLSLMGPRLARPGTPYRLRASAHDRWGNACTGSNAEIEVTAERAGREVYRRTIELGAGEWASAAVDDLPRDAGELKVMACMPGAADVKPAVHYVTIDPAAPSPRIFYADLHVHAHDTVGTNSPHYNTAYARDIAALDATAYTANDFQITDANWELGLKALAELHRDGEFLCYPVQEWCGSSTAGGDHNVVFLGETKPGFPYNARGEHNRTFTWNEDMKGTGVDLGRWPVEELWLAYIDDPENHLVMPHVGGRRYIPDWHHPELERLIEITSAWGHFGWLYQDVIERGYKLGASASGDEHRGRPGGGLPGTQVFGTKGGITGVIADALDRKSFGRALRARHTFAATGERVAAIARCGKHIQGDEFRHSGPAKIEYRFLGLQGWDEVMAYDHTGVIWRRDLQKEAGYSGRRIRVRWGGARIRDRYRWAEWRGTVSVVNGTINAFAGGGFEHPEESCWRAGPTDIAFRTDTYGDADSIVIDVSNLAHCRIRIQGRIDSYVKVGDPLAGNPFVHCPTFDWEVTGAELLASEGRLRKELGGCELFLAVERIADKATPIDVSGTLEIEPVNGPHGFRPVYFHGRQTDDAKVWTSAMFIDFV